MSKKRKHKEEKPPMEKPRELMTETPAPDVPANDPQQKPKPVLTTVLLSDVRAAAMRASADTAHNIAELESWRNEIDATIAFLRAQRK